MRTTITRQVTKRCPYADEIDVGTLSMTFEGEAPELYDLARRIDELGSEPITHEAFTATLIAAYPEATDVETRWRTGPWSVEVEL
jgi:hypothetical protein